jgi:pimeloyl-ACP methyl ester carboxylesterase
MWAGQVASFGERTRVLAPDLPGFAGTDPPAEPSMDAYAAAVRERLDAEGIERCLLVGFSLGGYVALAFLRKYPDMVAGLVLADTRSGADDAAALDRRRSAATRADGGDIAAGADAIAPLIADNATDEVRAQLARIAGEVPAPTIAWAQRAMAARPDSSAVLAATHVPVLIVVGELDAITPPAVARQMAALAPEAELVELPGVAHLTPAEDPVGFADDLTGWLARRF